MRWREYPRYKPSGVEWLGEVPEHWELKPLKRTFITLNGSTPKSSESDYWDGDILWATPDDLGSLTGDTLQKTRRTITQEGYKSCGTSLAPAGSLVLSTRAPIGHLAIAGVPMCTNQGCRCLIFRVKAGNRFFYYQLLTAKQELESWGQGSTFKELNRDRLTAIYLASPPFGEQRAIAAFLDRETARIDALIGKKQRQIELLQEKRVSLIRHAVTKGLDPDSPLIDSGVEWIGKIPTNWSKAPVYSRYHVQLGKMLDSKSITGDHLAPYVRNVDVQWDRVNIINLSEMDFSDDDKRRYRLEYGDLLICEGGEIGRTAIWREELEECYYQKAIHRLRPKYNSDNSRYFYYIMFAAAKSGFFIATGNPNTIDHLTAEKLRTHRFPFPPRNEQDIIVAFLEQETALIDGLITKVQESIDRLKEYRTALISAAVTGKIDVREEAA